MPVIARMRDATEAAAAIASDARELDDILMVVATEVGNAIDRIVGDLNGRIELLRAGDATPELVPPHDHSSALPQDNDRVLRLPEWLPRKKTTKESVEHQCSTAAA
jgi:hypothetical protein